MRQTQVQPMAFNYLDAVQRFGEYVWVMEKNIRSAASLDTEWVLIFLCGHLRKILALSPQLSFFF